MKFDPDEYKFAVDLLRYLELSTADKARYNAVLDAYDDFKSAINVNCTPSADTASALRNAERARIDAVESIFNQKKT